MLSRRSMLGLSGSLMAGAMLRPVLAAAPAPKAPEFSLFTKHLVGLPYDQLADVVAELGFTGVEAPVRRGGHVEPARVEEDLPKLVEAFKKRGVAITLMTSDINDVSEADRSEKVLRTARALGIPRYRMKWYPYSGKKSPWAELDEIRPRLKELVSLSKQVGILPCYQNHSGPKNVGAAIWDMATLMRDYQPDELSWNFDFFHAMVEGGLSWPNHLALARDHISMVYFKSFTWKGARSRLLCLENTVNREGGAAVSVADTDAMCDAAHAHGLRVHVDGARIFNAAVSLGVTPARLVREIDTVTFCMSKGLGCPMGSILAGDADFIAEARRWRKMVGGGLRQSGIFAAAGVIALDEMIDRMSVDHANAKALASGLANVPVPWHLPRRPVSQARHLLCL